MTHRQEVEELRRAMMELPAVTLGGLVHALGVGEKHRIEPPLLLHLLHGECRGRWLPSAHGGAHRAPQRAHQPHCVPTSQHAHQHCAHTSEWVWIHGR